MSWRGQKREQKKKSQTQTTSLSRAPTLLSLVFLFRTLLDPSLGGFPRAGSNRVSKRVSRSPSRLERQGEESSRREQGRVKFFFEKKKKPLFCWLQPLRPFFFYCQLLILFCFYLFFIFPNDKRLEPASSPPPPSPYPLSLAPDPAIKNKRVTMPRDGAATKTERRRPSSSSRLFAAASARARLSLPLFVSVALLLSLLAVSASSSASSSEPTEQVSSKQ